MKSKFLLPIVLFIVGCASAQLTEGGRGVRFVTSSMPTPSGCKYLGEVEGSFRDEPGNVSPSSGGRVNLKNKAAALGADTVQIISESSGDGWAKGEAYRCTKAEK